jgi:hypothetical protein
MFWFRFPAEYAAWNSLPRPGVTRKRDELSTRSIRRSRFLPSLTLDPSELGRECFLESWGWSWESKACSWHLRQEARRPCNWEGGDGAAEDFVREVREEENGYTLVREGPELLEAGETGCADHRSSILGHPVCEPADAGHKKIKR